MDGAPVSKRAQVLRTAAVVALLLCAVVLTTVAQSSTHGQLSAIKAITLGLVEGLTEWLPVSSTGHLTFAQDLMGLEGAAADSYAIAIQAGAILAVVGLYHHRFIAMVRSLFDANVEGRRTLIGIVVASLPTVAIGLALEDPIKRNLFGPTPVVIAWFVGGVAILLIERRRKSSVHKGKALLAITPHMALIIGIAQTLALWPGVSRSLVTILTGVAVGLSVPAAVEFSFLLGFVVLGGATLHETVKSGSVMVDAYGLATPILGAIVALLASVVAMRWMVAYLNRRNLQVFGWYRIGIALVGAALILTNAV